MLNIQQVTEAINHYHHNKGILKKIRRTEHPAISATERYLHSLQSNKTLLSNQDLFNINRFFLCDHPVKPGKASYEAWYTINYQNFCALNYSRVVQLDKRSKIEKMQEFFQVLSQCYQENILTDDRFLALSKLCVEGMLSQEYINAIKSNVQANFLVKCLIKMKHTDTLTTENQQFILTYSGSLIIPVTHCLVALDKAGLNTLSNREILAKFSFPIPLHRTIKLLEKLELLTQDNFDLISAEHNLSWLLALEEMPEALITAEVWQGLLNLSENSNENDFRKDIQAYAEVLKKKLNVERMEKDILGSEEHIETQAVTSIARSRFFSVTPATITPSREQVPKVNFAL